MKEEQEKEKEEEWKKKKKFEETILAKVLLASKVLQHEIFLQK
jgi:hypothetical protein